DDLWLAPRMIEEVIPAARRGLAVKLDQKSPDRRDRDQAPEGIDLVSEARAVREDQPSRPLGMAQRRLQADQPAERVADEAGPLDSQNVEQTDQNVGGLRQRRQQRAALREAAAGQVDRQYPVAGRQSADREAPVL